ncbi:MAG: DUF6519 domain-containing protein [candidate division Zixibacteria bacterium]
MKGDFSRITGIHAKREHYNSVLKQQGRVQLDSDWNELISIAAHQRRTRTIDTIGLCGAPVHNSGFEIRHHSDVEKDLLISTGRFYAGGLLCETYPASKIPIVSFIPNMNITVDDLKIDGEKLAVDQWILVFTDETPEGIICKITDINNKTLTLSEDVSSLSGETNHCLRRMILYSKQPDYPDAMSWNPVSDQKDLVYLDVWERHITTIEDPKIRETALGGPDTDTRIRTIAQVKILPNIGDVHCGDDISGWKAKITPGDGRLKTQVVKTVEPPTPCELGESGGYHGRENHLYRIEIHDGGALGTAKFKWSRDNASTAYTIEEFIPDSDPTKVFKIRLKQIGKDEVLKIKEHDWLEVSGDKTELHVDNPGTMAKVTKVEKSVLTLDTDVAVHENEKHPKIRRWDVASDAVSSLKKVEEGPINLEHGIQACFSGSIFKTGDYWLFTARAATGKIEELEYELPHGIKHHYCKLAIVKWREDGSAEIEDCRNVFPPLTELTKGGGCCTVTVGKNGDFDTVQEGVDALEGGPGTVCILPGIYTIDKPIIIKGNDITIKGCGGKSLILSQSESSEYGAIFIIEDSWGITICDLWAFTKEGDRALLSIHSHFVQIDDCLFLAAGDSDNSGAVVFRGSSVASGVRNCLIAGIIGIRFESSSERMTNLIASVKIERNTIFALESAVLQVGRTTILGSKITDNLLLGFALNSFMKIYFPPRFLAFAEKKAIYDKANIAEANRVKRDIGGIETTTKSNITPVYLFANHLMSEASTARVSVEYRTPADKVTTASPVIDLQAGAMDTNIANNIIIGKIGIHAEFLLESAIEKNMILAIGAGIDLGSFEGLSINENILFSGGSGIYCTGELALNLTVFDNRIMSRSSGIEFLKEGGDEKISQFIANIQIGLNFIDALVSGIKASNVALFIFDFTAFDNSITGCNECGIILSGIDELPKVPKDITSYQRTIQRNSIQVQQAGIVTGISDTKILDNDITIAHRTGNESLKYSYGISIFAESCTAANNKIEGRIVPETNLGSKGGIFIGELFEGRNEIVNKNAIIRENRITGGIGHGIEIWSNADGLNIENNLISDMGLNGIAVAEHVIRTDNLLISNNRILRCNRLIGVGGRWWKYAGIVLQSGSRIQIIGNQVCENGRKSNHNINVGGIYGQQLSEVIIANNQFIANGPESDNFENSQAVIDIPAIPKYPTGNSDVKVIDNLVKGSRAPALFLGGYWIYEIPPGGQEKQQKGTDIKVIITGNHFESLLHDFAVKLQCSQCVFSNNYVECGVEFKFSVDLGYGWYMTVIGNVTNRGFINNGYKQLIEHNVIF